MGYNKYNEDNMDIIYEREYLSEKPDTVGKKASAVMKKAPAKAKPAEKVEMSDESRKSFRKYYIAENSRKKEAPVRRTIRKENNPFASCPDIFPKDSVSIKRNPESNTIEVNFRYDPSDKLKELLCENGWSKKGKDGTCWHSIFNYKSREFATELAVKLSSSYKKCG